MIEFEVLKDLLDMVLDGGVDVIDVKGGHMLTKEEIKEFLDELCDGADGIEIEIDDHDDSEEQIEEQIEELSELNEEAKKTIANDISEYGKEYVLDKINIADAMTQIALGMDMTGPPSPRSHRSSETALSPFCRRFTSTA